jgi:hypothetical protein
MQAMTSVLVVLLLLLGTTTLACAMGAGVPEGFNTALVVGAAQYTTCPTVDEVAEGEEPLPAPRAVKCVTVTGGTISDNFGKLMAPLAAVLGWLAKALGGAV